MTETRPPNEKLDLLDVATTVKVLTAARHHAQIIGRVEHEIVEARRRLVVATGLLDDVQAELKDVLNALGLSL